MPMQRELKAAQLGAQTRKALLERTQKLVEARASSQNELLVAQSELSEAQLLAWSKDKLAGYKRPRACSFMRDEDMPRTATGKNLHRVLKTQLTAGKGG